MNQHCITITHKIYLISLLLISHTTQSSLDLSINLRDFNPSRPLKPQITKIKTTQNVTTSTHEIQKEIVQQYVTKIQAAGFEPNQTIKLQKDAFRKAGLDWNTCDTILKGLIRKQLGIQPKSFWAETKGTWLNREKAQNIMKTIQQLLLSNSILPNGIPTTVQEFKDQLSAQTNDQTTTTALSFLQNITTKLNNHDQPNIAILEQLATLLSPLETKEQQRVFNDILKQLRKLYYSFDGAEKSEGIKIYKIIAELLLQTFQKALPNSQTHPSSVILPTIINEPLTTDKQSETIPVLTRIDLVPQK